MASFKDTQVNPLATAVAPQAGVVDTSVGGEASALASGINTAASTVGSSIDAFLKNRTKGVAANHAIELTKIANAVAQGNITSSEGRTRSRALFISTVSSNPGSLSEVSTVHGKVLSTSGLGNVIATGTPEEQSREDFKATAFRLGIRDENGEGDEKTYLSILETQRRAGVLTAKLDARLKRLSVTAAVSAEQQTIDDLEDEVLGKESENILLSLVNDSMPEIRTKLEQTLSGVKDKSISREDGEIVIARMRAGVEAEVNKFSGKEVDLAFIKAAADPLLTLIDNYEKIIQGDERTKAFDNENKQVLALSLSNLLRDKDLVKLANLFKISGGTPAVLITPLTRALKKALPANAPPPNPDGSVPKHKEDPEGYGNFNILKKTNKEDTKALFKVNNSLTERALKTKDPKATDIAISQATGILKAVSKFDTPELEQKAFNDVAEYIAGPLFGELMLLHSGEIPPEIVAGASNVLEKRLTATKQAMITQWVNAEVTHTRGARPTGRLGPRPIEGDASVKGSASQFFEPVFVGNSVSFIPKEQGFSQNDLETAAGLNGKLAGLLNQSIRIVAHLGGTMDYRKAWLDVFKPIFDAAAIPPLEGPEKPAESPKPSSGTTPPESEEASPAPPGVDPEAFSISPEVVQLSFDEGGNVEIVDNDTEGNPTAGTGHKLTATERDKYPVGSKVPLDVRILWLRADLAKAKKQAESVLPNDASSELKSIFTNLIFNMGKGKKASKGKPGDGVLGFTKMFKAIREKDFTTAADELLKSSNGLDKSKFFKQTKGRAERLSNRLRALSGDTS